MYMDSRRGSASMALMATLLVSAYAVGMNQPIIVNVAEASVLTSPGAVEFQFIRHFSDATLEAAMEQYETFIRAVPQAVRGADLQPTEINTAPPIIVSLAQRQVKASFTVRFSMAIFNTPKTGTVQFAALCDKLAALADTLQCTLAHPAFYASDPESVVERAVARATENAYPAADAIATAVKTNIYAVDRVDIIEISWDQEPEGQTAETPQISCRAVVQVTYALAPQ